MFFGTAPRRHGALNPLKVPERWRCLLVLSIRTRPDDPDDKHCGWQFCKPSDPPVSNSAGCVSVTRIKEGWSLESNTDVPPALTTPLFSLSSFGSFSCDGCIEDTVGGHRFLRDLYDAQKDGAAR